MKAAGYFNGAVGKWGLAGHKPPWPAHPLDRGFDRFYGFLRHGAAHNHYPGNGGGIFDGTAEVKEGLTGIYDSDLFTAWAKAFIIEHSSRESGNPFFLYLAYTLPHFNMQLPPAPYPEGRGLQGGRAGRWRPSARRIPMSTQRSGTSTGLTAKSGMPQWWRASTIAWETSCSFCAT